MPRGRHRNQLLCHLIRSTLQTTHPSLTRSQQLRHPAQSLRCCPPPCYGPTQLPATLPSPVTPAPCISASPSASTHAHTAAGQLSTAAPEPHPRPPPASRAACPASAALLAQPAARAQRAACALAADKDRCRTAGFTRDKKSRMRWHHASSPTRTAWAQDLSTLASRCGSSSRLRSALLALLESWCRTVPARDACASESRPPRENGEPKTARVDFFRLLCNSEKIAARQKPQGHGHWPVAPLTTCGGPQPHHSNQITCVSRMYQVPPSAYVGRVLRPAGGNIFCSSCVIPRGSARVCAGWKRGCSSRPKL